MGDAPARTELKVTTGPIRGSRKIHVGNRKVAMRAVDLEPSSGEPPVILYDTSGPYTDPAQRIDIMAGLPELRRDWIRARGDVEEVAAREVQPEDNGQLGPDRSGGVQPFPNVRKRVLRAQPGANVTQMHYAKRGIRHARDGICRRPREHGPGGTPRAARRPGLRRLHPRLYADVEHVRVREDDVRPLANLPAPLARRVTVVDRRADIRCVQLRQCAGLVLRERLRRIEIERAALRVSRDRVQNGEVEGERLAGRRSGREDQVIAVRSDVERLTLVDVERGVGQRLAQPRVERFRKGRGARLGGRHRFDVGDLLAFEQFVPKCCADGHFCDGSLGSPGCPNGLRSHPSNLIRFVPAKGVGWFHVA